MPYSRFSNSRLAAFCLPAFAIHALVVLLTTFLPEFYANALGYPVAAVGATFMSIRILDMMLDPFLGGLMDRTRTRWGRFRPWLASSAPILMVSMFMLSQAQPGTSLLYLWVWLSVAFVGFSIIVLSHLAWTATLSSVPAERTRIFAWWQVLANLGQISILLAPPVVAYLAPADNAISVRVTGWIIVILIPLAILISFASGTGEREAPGGSNKKFTLKEYTQLFTQPIVLRLLGADLFLALGIGISGGVSLFFLMGQLGFARSTASALILVTYAATLFGTPLFTKLALEIGRARALQIGAICQAVLQLAVALQPAHTLWLSIVLMAGLGLCLPIAWFLPRALMADVADASLRIFGADRTGLLYATLNGTMKLALGLAIGAAFILLGAVGFQAADASNPAFSTPLRILAGAVPALFSLAAAACLRRYPEQAVRDTSARSSASSAG